MIRVTSPMTPERKTELVQHLLIERSHSCHATLDEMTHIVHRHNDNIIKISSSDDASATPNAAECQEALIDETVLSAYCATRFKITINELISVLSRYYQEVTKRTLYEEH
jgi:phage gp36-like protein